MGGSITRKISMGTFGILLLGSFILMMCGEAKPQSFITESGTIELDAPWELEILTDEYTIPGNLVKTEAGCFDGYCGYGFRRAEDDNSLLLELFIYDNEPETSFKEFINSVLDWDYLNPGKWTATDNGQEMYWARGKYGDNDYSAFINITDMDAEKLKEAELKFWEFSDDQETLLAISKSFKLTPLDLPGFEAFLALIMMLAMSCMKRY